MFEQIADQADGGLGEVIVHCLGGCFRIPGGEGLDDAEVLCVFFHAVVVFDVLPFVVTDLSVGAQNFSNQPLHLRMRADLQVQPLQFGGKTYWGIKDPFSLQYYQLRDEEYFILKQLDGVASFESIRRQYEKKFLPQKLDASHLQGFLSRLHEAGLILADALGQGEILLERQIQKQQQARRARWADRAACPASAEGVVPV